MAFSLFSCKLLLAGDRNHIVPKTVTVPELEVLRKLHGDDAVTDVQPSQKPGLQLNHNEERDRLKRVFKKNLPAPDASGRQNVVDVVFPNPRANLPTTLKEIGITDYKPAVKGKAKGGDSTEGAKAESDEKLV